MARTHRQIHTITPSILARWLEVKPETVLIWIRRKQLPALNIGTRGDAPRFRIFRKDLEVFLLQRGMSPSRIQDLVRF